MVEGKYGELMRASLERIKDRPIPAPRGIELKRDVETVLSALGDREKIVVESRFGLTDGRRRTQAEVGRVIGRSDRTVRRIEKTALAKLRAAQAPALDQYLDKGESKSDS